MVPFLLKDKIREGLVIRLMAADEVMSIEDAAEFWSKWKAELEKNPEHFGDCTKEPQTCNRCLVEEYYRQANDILQYLDSWGVVLKVERELPVEGLHLPGNFRHPNWLQRAEVEAIMALATERLIEEGK